MPTTLELVKNKNSKSDISPSDEEKKIIEYLALAFLININHLKGSLFDSDKGASRQYASSDLYVYNYTKESFPKLDPNTASGFDKLLEKNEENLKKIRDLGDIFTDTEMPEFQREDERSSARGFYTPKKACVIKPEGLILIKEIDKPRFITLVVEMGLPTNKKTDNFPYDFKNLAELIYDNNVGEYFQGTK